MKRFFFLFFFLHACTLFSQDISIEPAVSIPRTYAVVIGISQYENNGIGSLEYAHRDAEIFASFLQSKAGGSVPEENIRVLLNEKATFAAMYTAIEWLLETVGKDDIVFFYFSGHGDKESVTIRNLGYLLSYNTPRTNYINNALRIEDLNDYANVLSVKNNAKVILITDACHSGKLVGNENRGTFLVGEQLRKVLSNEIRITSSGPDQLSNEDQGWGGGRGVFSYYLINGLEGQAEKNNDGIITVSELKSYLETSLAADPLLAQKENKQDPVVNGADAFKLAVVDKTIMGSGLAPGPVVAIGDAGNEEFLPPIPKPPVAYFFEAFEKINPEELVDYKKLNEFAAEEIPFALMDAIKANKNVNLDVDKFEALKSSLSRNDYTLKRFISKLVVLLVDRSQSVINLYLEGDEAELERRRYYNSKSNGYDVYPEMLSLALKITSPDDKLYKKIQIKYHYFSGIVARLKMPLVADYEPLLATALEEQNKAYALEENAAYINNELGILSRYKNESAKAEQYYKRATQIAPQWVVPQANLIGLYAAMNRIDEGFDQLAKAKELNPAYQGIFLNAGVLFEKQNNLLFGEEMYRRSIEMNSSHYLPFDRLANIFLKTTNYALADSFFYEADQRKKGFHFILTDSDGDGVTDQFDVEQNTMMSPPCKLEFKKLQKSDVASYFVLGIQSYFNQEFSLAKQYFKTVVEFDRSNPLVYHYLGKMAYQQELWLEGDVYFNLAINNFLEKDEFDKYCDSLEKHFSSSDRDCIMKNFKKQYYKSIEDYFFLSSIYEKLNYYTEAAQTYRKIIAINPGYIGGYYKLWNLFENIYRFEDAASVIQTFKKYDREQADNEMLEFYKRMIQRNPNNAEWNYKAGDFLYQLVVASPDKYYNELSSDKMDFLDSPIDMLDSDYKLLPGTGESINAAAEISNPRSGAIIYFLKADSLFMSSAIEKADINYKIGDLYMMLRKPLEAAKFYKISVDILPINSSARIKMIDIYDKHYYYQAGMEQLDSLNNKNELNFPNLVLLAKYDMHAGAFNKSDVLLQRADSVYPYKITAIDDLRGRLNLLAANPKKALPFYQNFLSANPGDYSTMYTIAKLYALSDNQQSAWKWLEKAVDSGFRYSWVLEFDPSWEKYRSQSKWKTIKSRYPMKTYSSQENR